MNKIKQVNILGTKYKILFSSEREDVKLKDISGYCDYSIKLIVVKKIEEQDKTIMDLGDLDRIANRVLRHEIIHAFMYESGLWCNTVGCENWATNEEMTDWFAIQSPKIFKVYKKLEVL